MQLRTAEPMLGIGGKPEPCSSADREHQCQVGLSLPNPILFCQTCQAAFVSAAGDAPVRAPARFGRDRPLLISTPEAYVKPRASRKVTTHPRCVQFAEGLSARSTTKTSAGAVVRSSFSPHCSGNA